jgi:hypothetical protein
MCRWTLGAPVIQTIGICCLSRKINEGRAENNSQLHKQLGKLITLHKYTYTLWEREREREIRSLEMTSFLWIDVIRFSFCLVFYVWRVCTYAVLRLCCRLSCVVRRIRYVISPVRLLAKLLCKSQFITVILYKQTFRKQRNNTGCSSAVHVVYCVKCQDQRGAWTFVNHSTLDKHINQKRQHDKVLVLIQPIRFDTRWSSSG